MLLDGREAHQVVPGQLGDALLPTDGAANDVAPRRVGQGAEHAVEVGGNDLHYTTIRLPIAVSRRRFRSLAAWRRRARRTIPGVNDVLLLLIVILVIVLVLRGPKTLPQIGRMFGQGVREAREEIKVRKDDEPGDPPASTPANTSAGGGTTSA